MAPLVPAAMLAVGAGRLPAQQQGSIAGRVTEQGSGRPVEAVQVSVVGTTLGAITNAEGRYTIRGVPAGTHQVRALRVGYSERKQAATVAAGQAATLDLTMESVPVSLAPVVTTATGEQRRVELGNSVSQIDASKVVETAPVSSMNDLLQARSPSVTLTQGNQTGAGARIRIRGQGSLNLSNDPIYVIDGVRMLGTSDASNIFTGGSQPSRMQDINPEEIESIEIVKGPSAATLYGTDAANGVVVISTKKGRAGAPRWNAYGEGGIVRDLNTYPTAYTLAGHAPNATAYRECTLPQVSRGECIADSLRTLNVFDDDETTVLGTGRRQQYGLQVSGGTETVRYFTGGEIENEIGVLKLPRFERDRLGEEGVPIRDEWDRPNTLDRISLRGNLNAAVTPKLDLGLTTNYISLRQRFSKESNATAGIGSQAFGGKGYKENGNVSGVGNPLRGYRAFTPGQIFQELNREKINRFIGGLNANWRPTTWLQGRANMGVDYNSQLDLDFLGNGQGAPLTATYRRGFANDSRISERNLSFDVAATASFQPRPWLSAKTTAGAQYVNYLWELARATGTELPPGGQTPTQGTIATVGAANVLQKTLGVFIEEAVALNDRLFLTAALRTDQNSAFGTDFQNVYYPKGSISWLASEESFFPRIPGMNEFRLRAAYGASGTQPGPNDALRFFQQATVNVQNTDQGGLQSGAIGNTELRPEKATEFEGGFDVKFLDSRLNLELTYYNKLTKDALISAIVPPSAGDTSRVRDNLGSVKNVGWEALVSAQLVNRRAFGWDASVAASTNKNTLVSLGGLPPQITTITRAQVGYPLFGYWQRQISRVEDKNGDGILTYNSNATLNEVFVDDSSTFIGSSAPRHTVSLSSGVELFGRRLRVQGLLDYKGGHYLFNETERIRCGSRGNCRGLNDRTASFAEQAASVAFRDHVARTQAGFFDKADVLRLREVSATYTASPSLAALVRARSLAFTLAGRNLAKWTGYDGIDPESDFRAGVAPAGGGDVPSEFQTLAPQSYFTFRVNVGF